jgi:hypothetical protein
MPPADRIVQPIPSASSRAATPVKNAIAVCWRSCLSVSSTVSAVALVAGDALEAQAGLPGHRPGQGHGGVVRFVHRHQDPPARRQLGQQADLGRMRHRVGHEDVVEPGAGQYGGLPHGRRGQAARARLDLPPGQLGALVRLVVRPDGSRPELGERGRHVIDVALRRVDVEHQRRGEKLLAAPADVLPVLAQHVIPGLVEPQHRASPRQLTLDSGPPGPAPARRAGAGTGWPARRTSGPCVPAAGRSHPRPTRRPR